MKCPDWDSVPSSGVLKGRCTAGDSVLQTEISYPKVRVSDTIRTIVTIAEVLTPHVKMVGRWMAVVEGDGAGHETISQILVRNGLAVRPTTRSFENVWGWQHRDKQQGRESDSAADQ